MADDLQVGRLGIDVEANLDSFAQQSQNELRRVAERVGAEMERSVATGFRRGRSMPRAAERSVDEFVTSAKRSLKRRESEISEEVARGFLSEKAARQQAQRATKAFNDTILREIDRRAQTGRLRNADYLGLAGALKKTSERATDEMRTPFERFQGWMRTGFAAGILAAAGYAATRMVALFRSAARAIQGVLQEGSRSITAGEGFAALTGRRGLGASSTLEALRRGTLGQVSDLELMQRANLALLSSLPVTERSLERVAVVSRRLGQVVGKDATEAFGYFIRAIETAQSDMLKQLGITTTLEGALRRYRQETGESTANLSEQQRILILYNEVMAEAEQKVAAMGEETVTAGHRLDQLGTFFTNLKVKSSEAIAESPRIVEFLNELGTSAERSADRVDMAAMRVGALADAVADLGAIGARVGGGALFRTLADWPVVGPLVGGGAALLQARAEPHLQRRIRERALEESISRTLSDIQGETTIEALEARARRNQEQARMADPQDLETWTRINREGLAILERMKELRATGGGEVPDADAIKQATAALEQFRRSQLSDAQRNLEDLEKLRGAALLTGDSDALAQIEPLIHNARREVERLNQVAAQMPELFARIQPAVQSTFGELATAGIDATTSLQAFERDYSLTMARLREESERGILSDEEFQKAEQQAIDEFNKKLLELIESLRKAGLISEQVYLALTGAFKDGGKDVDKFSASLSNVAHLARGMLSVADAAGKIGENARRSLQGVIDLAEGIAAIKNAEGKLAGIMSGGVMALGGVIGLMSGLFSESPAERERREAIRRNTEALQDMTLELRGFRVTADVIANARRGVSGALGAVGGLLGGGGTRAAMGTRAFEELLARHFGISAGELDRIAKDLGIEIRDGSGRLMRDGLEQLVEALDQAGAALVGFRQTVSDQRRQGDLEADIFDRDDDAFSRLQRETDLLRQFAPGLVPAGLDPSTPEGRAALEALIRTLFTQFAAGDLDLGGLTRDEFLDLIETIEGLLDETEGGVVGGDGSVRLGVSITEVQASRMLSELSTQTYYLSKIAGALVGPLPSAPLALPQVAPAATATTIRTGDLEFIFPNVRGTMTPEVGRAVGIAAADSMRSRLSAAQHAAGGQGTSRIVVQTGG